VCGGQLPEVGARSSGDVHRGDIGSQALGEVGIPEHADIYDGDLEAGGEQAVAHESVFGCLGVQGAE
jgi:hypothetical protein